MGPDRVSRTTFAKSIAAFPAAIQAGRGWNQT